MKFIVGGGPLVPSGLISLLFYECVEMINILMIFQTIQHHKILKKVSSVIKSGEELDTLGIWLGCDPNDVTRLRNADHNVRDAAYQILSGFYELFPNEERWGILIEALEELNKHTTIKELRLEELRQQQS